MFYHHYVLAKKGPLARIWLAAHWETKLTKMQVLETNLEQCVAGILEPKVKISLRTEAHLLVGIMRVFSRKAKYLLQDCSEASVKIKLAFRPCDMVDLPDHALKAPLHAITLPEALHDFDTADSDQLHLCMDEDNGEELQPCKTSRIREITMEDFPEAASSGLPDDTFGDVAGEEGGFDIEEIARAGSMGQSMAQENADIDMNGLSASANATNETTMPYVAEHSFRPSSINSGFFGQPASPQVTDEASQAEVGSSRLGGTLSIVSLPSSDTTTVINNEHETFALPPVDASVCRSFNARVKRRRRLVVDGAKELSNADLKRQLENTDDIVIDCPEIAPPTKMLMQMREMGLVDKLMTRPARVLNSKLLLELYQGKLLHETDENLEFDDVMHLEEALRVQKKKTRKKKKRPLAAIHELDEEVLESPRKLARNEEQHPGSATPTPDIDIEIRAPSSMSNASWAAASVLGGNSALEPQMHDETNEMDVSNPAENSLAACKIMEESHDGALSSRAAQLHERLQTRFEAGEDRVSFLALNKNNTRRAAAQAFYSLLMLKTKNSIDVEQDEEDIEAEIFIKGMLGR